MLALLDSLLQEGGFDPEDQGRRALSWHREGAYAPGKVVFDIGSTTATALRALARGVPAHYAGPDDDRSCGNGSLMRILPLALVERRASEEELIAHAHLASRVTHGHPRCQVACAWYVLLVTALLRGSSPSEALEHGRERLRAVYQRDPALAPHLGALAEIEDWTERGGRGFVIDAFWSAWEAFAGADDYAATIRRAVAYGHDTDTTAAIAGGLAGARWGIEGIPAAWLHDMRGQTIVAPLLARLLATEF
jgi:ADP-ribosylglycohydrolase